jgi:hypothetical protein
VTAVVRWVADRFQALVAGLPTRGLTDDRQFAFGDRCHFPNVGHLPPGRWVGCGWTLAMVKK